MVMGWVIVRIDLDGSLEFAHRSWRRTLAGEDTPDAIAGNGVGRVELHRRTEAGQRLLRFTLLQKGQALLAIPVSQDSSVLLEPRRLLGTREGRQEEEEEKAGDPSGARRRTPRQTRFC